MSSNNLISTIEITEGKTILKVTNVDIDQDTARVNAIKVSVLEADPEDNEWRLVYKINFNNKLEISSDKNFPIKYVSLVARLYDTVQSIINHEEDKLSLLYINPQEFGEMSSE